MFISVIEACTSIMNSYFLWTKNKDFLVFKRISRKNRTKIKSLLELMLHSSVPGVVPFEFSLRFACDSKSMQTVFVFPMESCKMDIDLRHLQSNRSKIQWIVIVIKNWRSSKQNKTSKKLELLRRQQQFVQHHIKSIAVYSSKQKAQRQLSNYTVESKQIESDIIHFWRFSLKKYRQK